MTVINIFEELVSFLPSSLTVANGDSFGIDWSPALEGDIDTGAPPYGTFRFVGTDVTDPFPLHNGYVESTQSQTDTFTFDDTEDIYQVSERHINSITSVEDASGDTFTEGTDFEVFSTSDYTTDDAIQWLDGGSTPDDGEDFDVKYEHILVSRSVEMRQFLTYRLVFKVAEVPSSDAEASKFYYKTYLGQELMSALIEFFDKNDGAPLISGSEPLLYFSDYANFGRTNIDDADDIARYVIDIRLNRKREVTKDATFRVTGKHLITTSTA